MEFLPVNNLFYRFCCIALIILHLVTFGPVKDALAFTASSVNYKLTSAALSEGGKSRAGAVSKVWQDIIGEPCAGKVASANFILNAGLISAILSNPPILLQKIPYQRWPMNQEKTSAFDLDSYFSSPEGYAFSYSVSGNSQISVTIDPVTHVASFSQAADWSGVEKVYFTATDTEGSSIRSNKVALLVENPSGQDKPVIVDTAVIPSNIQEGNLVKITTKAIDLDNEDVTFTYSEFFSETARYREGALWVSEATWQTGVSSRGHYNIRVTAKDINNLTDTEDVLVNIGNFNHPPVLDSISPITANEGDTVVISAHATDPDNDALNLYYSAPFDTQGKWITNYDSSGTYSIQVTASDGIDTVSKTASVAINNTNRPPEVNLTLSRYTTIPGQAFSINLSASDPDGDALSFVLKKDGSQIASGSLTSIYTTTTSFSSLGDHEISAIVTDTGSLSTTAVKGVDVTEANSAINPVMGDFNGDALTDLGLHDANSGKWEVCLSDKGIFRNAVDWLTSFGSSRDWIPTGGDFNGDAKTDVGVYNSTTGELKIALSSGSSFGIQGTWLSFSGASASWQPFSANFNADKYSDFALYNKDSGEVRVALGTGSGLAALTTWATSTGTDYTAMSGDFNGDSVSDLGLFRKSSGEFKVYFSNTKAFADGSSWISGFATGTDILVSDFNHDGLTDIGYWDKSSAKWYYAASLGNRFQDKGLWLDSFGSSADESATTGDFDGNGVTDAATFDRDALGIDRWTTHLSTNKPADLLTTVDNGIGGKTSVVYTYAAMTDNPALPFPVYVASSASLINTFPVDRAATYTQNFNFSGGYFDTSEREFRGFAKVVVKDPITNNYTETYFYQGKPGQDGALKGQIEKVLAYDGNAKKISETLNTYEVKKSGPEAGFLGFPALIEQTSTVYEENLSSVATKNKFIYDNIGNLLEQISEGNSAIVGDEKSAVTAYAQAYNIGFNRPLEALLKDKEGNMVSRKSFEYDNKGNLTRDKIWIFNPFNTDCEISSSDYSYDSFGNLVSSSNALGSTVSTEYESDFYAYPQKVTNSLGHIIQYAYEPKFGAVKTVTDANGAITTTTYDSLGRVLQAKNALNQVVSTFSYPDFNTKVSTNAIGLYSTEYIDGLGRKYRTVSPGEDGVVSRRVSSEVYFNNRGLTDRESLPHYVDEDSAQISYIRYEYDIRGRVKKTISDFTGTTADAQSTVNYLSPLYTESTDPLGHRKGALKDVYGNVIEIREFVTAEPEAKADGAFHTYYEYDIQGNLIKTTDNKGNITQIFYDSIGRKLKMIDPDMGTWTYEYDAIGNLIRQADAKGQVLEFFYDALNRLTQKQGLSPQGTVPVSYLYDDTAKSYCIGRLSKVTDQSGSTEFFYDKLGREIKSVKGLSPQGTVTEQFVVQREYDILDRLTKLIYPDGEAVTYSYDINSGALENVEGLSPQGTVPYVQDVSYNAKGQIKTLKYGNNVQTNYTYGQDLRLSRIQTQGTVPVQDLLYQFDKNGNVTTLNDNLRSNIRTYTYDSLDRLTRADNSPAPVGGYTTFSFQYDSIGNMTYKSDLGTMTYGEGLSPQGTVPKPHALTSAGGYAYQYDANGNMVIGKNKTFAYDAENRLREVNESGAITSFTYDGDGGRVRKGLSPQGTVPEQWTVYIGSLFEKDSDGTIRKHIYAGSNRVATKGLSPQGTVPEISYYHSDHLGSSNVITDKNGNQLQYCEYSPYGAIARNEGTDVVKHKFTGKELDNTGLYYYGARYYDPEIGRFIAPDSIVQAPFDPQTLNRYAYCRNNPLKYVDPSGHIFWFAAIAIAAAIGAATGAAVAAVTGGDVGKGALFGAISGAVFWGAGQTIAVLARTMSIAADSTAMATLSAGVHTLAGGASGALGALATGGDVGLNAAIGGISAGVSSVVGSAFPIEGDGLGAVAARGAQRTLVGAILGGGTSLVMGGSFGEGAAQGAITSAVAYTTNCLGAFAIPAVAEGLSVLAGAAVRALIVAIGVSMATDAVRRMPRSNGAYFRHHTSNEGQAGIKATGEIWPSSSDKSRGAGVYFTKSWVPASWVSPASAETYVDVWVPSSIYGNSALWSSYKCGIEQVYRGGSYPIYNDPAHPPIFGNGG